MSFAVVVELARGALLVAFKLAAPLLIIALVVGLAVSVVQAVTQVQEQTLSFVPKLIAVGVAFLVLLTWMLHVIVAYTSDLFSSLPALVS